MAICFARNEREFKKLFKNIMLDDMFTVYLNHNGYHTDPFPTIQDLMDWGWKTYESKALPTSIFVANWPVWSRKQVYRMCSDVWKKFLMQKE